MEKSTLPPGTSDPISQTPDAIQVAADNITDDLGKGAMTDINPLVHISREQLMQDVSDFATQNALTSILPLLQKGALVAQNPQAFEEVPELDETERAALRDETDHRWRLPKTLYLTIAMNSIAGAIQGWDQTGSNGANLSFPQEFGIPGSGDVCEAAGTCAKNNWIIGFVNSAPYIAIFVVALFLNDPLNRWFGRRGTIFIACIFSLLSPIGSAVSQTWGQLTACRILLGVGMGLKEVTVPRFSAEIAPTNVRGAMTMSWQIWNSMGGVFGGIANLIFYNIGKNAWRFQVGSAVVPAIPLLLGIYFCPESPRWYLKKGQYGKAYKSLCRLRNTELQAARDLYYIHAQLVKEEVLILRSVGATKTDNQLTRFVELWSIPRIRRGTQAASVLMIAQQMCGVNVTGFYGATIFTQAGASIQSALLVSWGQSMIFAAFCIPSLWLIDTLGRRTLLLATFPQMFWTLLAAGFCFLIPEGSRAHLGLIALFVFLFTSQYSLGEGVCAFVYGAEVFPLSHSEMGMSWAIATNNFWATALSLTFPRMLSAMGATGAFGFYAGLNIVALVFIFLVCPETSKLSLEELDSVFSVSTLTHAKYQCTEVLPWWVRRWILQWKDESCLSLFEFQAEVRAKKQM